MSPRSTAAVVLSAGALLASFAVAGPAAAAVPGPSDNTPAKCSAATVADCPSTDPFYAAPANLASLAPGSVIRSRPAAVAPPNGPDVAAAFTVLYRSNDSFDAPVADATTVLLPRTPFAGTGAQPLVSVQFAEDSLGRQCAPSYALLHGTNGVISAEISNVQALLDLGYVVSTPDYQGPAEQFIAGRQSGHGVLDGLRASKALPQAKLGKSTPVGLFGYSGGGYATTWAGELAKTYAPDLDLVGIAAGGVPADLKATAKLNDGTATFGLVALAAQGLDRGFPKGGIAGKLNAAGKAMFASLSTTCVQDGVTALPFRRLDEFTTEPGLLDSPAFQQLFDDNKLGTMPPSVPYYEFHGVPDNVVPYPQALALVKAYCAAGVPVTHVPLVAEHLSGEAQGAPAALAFLAGRFNGAPVTDNCAATAALDPVAMAVGMLPTAAVPPGGAAASPSAAAAASPSAAASPAASSPAAASEAPSPARSLSAAPTTSTSGSQTLSSTGSLPRTGGESALALLSLVLVAVGGALVLRRRPGALSAQRDRS